MGVPDPSVRGDAGLNRRLSKSEKDVEQLRRLITRIPKAEAPPVGGVIEGITRIYATSRTALANLTNTNVNPADLEVGEQLYGEPVASLSGDSVTLAEGLYVVKMDAWLSWSLAGTATRCQFWMDYAGSVYHYPRHDVPVFPDLINPGSNGPDAIDTWTVGPIAADAGTLSFGATFDGTGSAPFVNYWSLDVCKVG